MVGESGRVHGGLTPFNYSPQVWVDPTDDAAVEERFSIIEGADAGDCAALLPEQRRARAGRVAGRAVDPRQTDLFGDGKKGKN